MTTLTLTNGRIFTAQSADHFASAMRIVDGVIDWIGDEADLSESELASAHDLAGATVLPGLLDVHIHPIFTATLAGAANLLPPAVTTLDELIEALRAQPTVGVLDADGNPRWIEGFGYDESTFEGRRKPDRHDLDRVSTCQPVFIRRCDGHNGSVNTAALALCGITTKTPDPHGGRFERESGGFPSGVLTEHSATSVVAEHKPAQTAADIVQELGQVGRHYLSEGLVGVCDLLASFIDEPLERVREANGSGFVQQCPIYLGWAEAIRDYPEGLTDADRSGPVHIAGLKVFIDGAFSDQTAWCKCAYRDSTETGIRTLTDEDFATAVAWARANKIQLSCHAMGDAAVQFVLDALGDEEPWLTDVPCVRIEHATLVSDEMIDQLNAARMSFAVISHTIFYFAEYASYEAALTDELAGEAYPIRRYFDRVPATALSSDAPATAWATADHVFSSVKAAVVRKSHTGADIGQAQAVSLGEALLLYTARAASVARFDRLGKLAPGMLGSFVVLDRDPFAIDPEELDLVTVAETWLEGELAYSAGSKSSTGGLSVTTSP
ncbi:amidohydrolase [Granulicoccus sp. GXG6511]|uniref:amidohydrolase n=1 Tax=Granulicoccus sp. GXG6511 TaxID=3381351 RepID=UPI003D7CC836